MQAISRHYSDPISIVCTASPATTTRIAFATAAGGALSIASTGGATQLLWYAAPDMRTTPTPLFDGGVPVVTAVTVGVHALPDATYGCHVLAPVVSNGTLAAVLTVKG